MWRLRRVSDDRFLLHGSHRKSSPKTDEMGYDGGGGCGGCGVMVALDGSVESTAYEKFDCRVCVVRRPDDGRESNRERCNTLGHNVDSEKLKHVS